MREREKERGRGEREREGARLTCCSSPRGRAGRRAVGSPFSCYLCVPHPAQDQLRVYRQREAILGKELKDAQHEARLWKTRAESHQDHIDSLHEELHRGRDAMVRGSCGRQRH